MKDTIELTQNEMELISGGGVSGDAVYSTGISVGTVALGALIAVSTAGFAITPVGAIAIGALGLGGALSAAWAAW